MGRHIHLPGIPPVQKELTLEELQGLIDSLVQQAAATHDGAFQLSVQVPCVLQRCPNPCTLAV